MASSKSDSRQLGGRCLQLGRRLGEGAVSANARACAMRECEQRFAGAQAARSRCSNASIAESIGNRPPSRERVSGGFLALAHRFRRAH
jgi:hypothetical protein